MVKYRYIAYHDVSCTNEFCIHQVNDDNQYVVELEGEFIGALFVDGFDPETGKAIWKGDTTEVNLSAALLGAWIEETDAAAAG